MQYREKITIDGKCYTTREGNLYRNMISRVFPSAKRKQQFPTYNDCTISDMFKDFQLFCEWCSRQKGFYNKNPNGKHWCIDKDILKKGNKHYSEDYCVFVPNLINVFFTKRQNDRGAYPIGVSIHNKGKFLASCLDPLNRYKRHLGEFNTPVEAFFKYKETKEQYAKDLAEEYKDLLDARVVDALLAYKVDIND